MKRRLIIAAAVLLAIPTAAQERATVLFTKNITPESLVSIYRALGVEATGRVALKISTGESERSNHLRPAFIKPLVDETKATIVECNTPTAATARPQRPTVAQSASAVMTGLPRSTSWTRRGR